MAKNKNYSIRFWENWWEAVEEMDDQELGKTLRIIFDYSFRDKKPEKLNPMQKMFFNLCKPILDSNREAYDNGNLGGRPKKTTSKTSAEKGGKKGGFNPPDNHVGNPTENPLENPIENHTVTVTDTVTVTGTEKDTDTDTETEKENSVFFELDSSYDFAWKCVGAWETIMRRSSGEVPTKNLDALERASDRYTLEDIKGMLAYKKKDWENTEFYKYFHPKTLFNPEKFDSYMNEYFLSKEIPESFEDEQRRKNEEYIAELQEIKPKFVVNNGGLED